MTDDAASVHAREYDYVVVGGGTGGSLVATRLAERSGATVALIEWGPDDRVEPRANTLRRWPEMLESEYDLDYRSVPQERGNSNIRQARMRILGGCSNANTMIAWRPLGSDLEEWVDLGAKGWNPEAVLPYFDRLRTPIEPVAPSDQNPCVADVVASATKALHLPLKHWWNDGTLDAAAEGAGFFEVGYTPETNQRASTSFHYLHALGERRSSLHVFTGLQAQRVLFRGTRAKGILARKDDGSSETFSSRRETVICCGTIDSAKLLQLSGVGPRSVLDPLGIDVVADLPVGENLMDHPEGLVVWESRTAPAAARASGWDAGAMMSVEGDPRKPDILMHFPVDAVADHAVAMGVRMPQHIVSVVPNVAKPASRGRVWITSRDPADKPCIDYRYFTDPDRHDERMLVAGMRAARQIAAYEPFRSRLVREVFPGPEVTRDEQLSELARATHQTVYHVCGTCRMGAADDPSAVLDPQLRVRGTGGLRVVDASVFPTITSVNPVVTIMVVAERAAALMSTV